MPLSSYAPSSNHESGYGSGGGEGATQTITTIETISSSPVIGIILTSNSGHIVNGTTLSHKGYTVLELSSGSDVIFGETLTSGEVIIMGRDVVACAWRFGGRCWWNNNQVFDYWI
jgi:hypothetical protein